MSTERKGLGIFVKMLFVMLAVALIPTSLIWYAGYRNESTLLNRGVEVRLTSTAERLAQYTDQWLDGHMRMMRLVATHPDAISMDGARQLPLLKGIAEQYPYIYLAHTIRLDGLNEGRSDGKPNAFYGDRQYFRDALGPKGYGIDVVLGKTSNLPALLLAVPIQREGKNVGVLTAALLIDDVSKLIVDAQIGKTGFAFLLDAKGKVVAHPEKEFARVQKDLSAHPAFVAFKNEGKQPFMLDDGNGKEVIAVAVPTREGMTMITQQDTGEAYAPIRDATKQAGQLLAGSLALVVLLAFAFSRGFTSPIRRLTSAAEKFSLGDLTTDIPEAARGDELGGLARAIDRMGISLKLAITQLEQRMPARQEMPTLPSGSIPAAPMRQEFPSTASTRSSRPPPRTSVIVPAGDVESKGTRQTGS